METYKNEAEEIAALETAVSGDAKFDSSENDESKDSDAKEAETKEDDISKGFDGEDIVSEDGEEKPDDKKDIPAPKEDQKEKPEFVETEKKETVALPKRPSVYPALKEGDYSEKDDGTFEIKAKHLAEDITSILEKDAGVFLKIAKAKPEKAAAIAKILGIRGDSTRDRVGVFSDVVRQLKKETDKDKRNDLLSEHLPFLVDRNEDAPFTVAGDLRELADDEKGGEVIVTPAEEKGATGEEITNVMYRVVAESEGKITMKDLKESEDLLNALDKYQFDPKTGKQNTMYKQLSLASEDVFLSDEGEAENDLPRRVGGVSQKSSSSGETTTDTETALEKALMGEF